MGLLAPVALGLLALAVPIIILYMLKLRRQDRPVSSVLLWERALRDLQANAPWQRLQKNLLLFLQLLLLLLLVLALARPFFAHASTPRGNLVVLLDTSASMAATDVSPSRFEAGRARVRQMIDDLDSADRMTLVAVSSIAEVLAASTADKATLRQALDRLEPRPTTTNMAEAMALAAAAAGRSANAHIVIVSDGAFSPLDLQSVPAAVTHLPVGAGSDNLAVTALAVRDGPAGPQLFARLANYSLQRARVLLSIQVDGTLFDAREVTLEPRGTAGITLNDLPPGTQMVQARLEAREGPDHLALDNTAWARRGSARPARILLVTPGNLFLERSLGLIPNLEVFKTSPGPNLPAEPYDLYVFDGAEPAQLPAGSLLLINPPAPSQVVSVTGEIELPQVSRVAASDPLLRYVDLRDLQVASARALDTPTWARAIVQAGDRPLLLAGEAESGRRAVIAFDLHRSDLPLRVAFPVLMANLVGWLSPQASAELPAHVQPGEPVSLPVEPGTEEVVVERPDGVRRTYSSPAAAIAFVETALPGTYRVAKHRDGAETVDYFVVSLLSEAESDISPRPVAEKEAEGQTASTTTPSRRELWRLILLAALGLAMVEWWVFYRGTPRWKMPSREVRK